MANQAVALRERVANSYPEDTTARTAVSSARARLTTIRSRSGVFGAVPRQTNASMAAGSLELFRGYEQLGDMLQLAGDTPVGIRAYSSAITELHAGEPKADYGGIWRASTSSCRTLYSVVETKGSDIYRRSGSAEIIRSVGIVPSITGGRPDSRQSPRVTAETEPL